MPVAIHILTLLCTLLWFVKKEKSGVSLLTKVGLRVKSQDIYFSGNSICKNPLHKDDPDPPPLKIHALFIATFMHYSRSHIINNMLMMYGIAEFETKIGTLPFCILFVMCGAVGWLSSLGWRRLRFPEMWSAGYVQFTESAGASPATYGVAVAAATAMGDEPVGYTLGLSPATWVWLLLVLPKFCGDRYEVNLLVYPTKWTLKALGAASTVILMCYASSEVIVPEPLAADRWMVLYLGMNYVISFLKPSYLRGEKQEADTTDHTSHLGGALLGLWWGAWLSGGVGLYRVEVWLCVLWLASRVALTKQESE